MDILIPVPAYAPGIATHPHGKGKLAEQLENEKALAEDQGLTEEEVELAVQHDQQHARAQREQADEHLVRDSAHWQASQDYRGKEEQHEGLAVTVGDPTGPFLILTCHESPSRRS